jgi:predicted ATPase
MIGTSRLSVYTIGTLCPAMPPLTDFEATFRCLRDVKMDFTSPEDGTPSPFIALVGPNGAGKTTVLDAVALTIFYLVQFSLIGRRESAIIRDDERIVLRYGEPYFVHQREGVGFRRHGEVPPPELVQDFGRALYIRSGYLPILPVGVPLQHGPALGMDLKLALLPQNSASVQRRVEIMHQWWLHLHWEYPKTTTLDRLWEALRPFLGDLVYAGVNPADHLPWFDDRGTRVSFNELSSGQRRLILLFLEIVMQCGEDGLVLFDEPEAHFHPFWQERLPEALCRLVPRGQVIVATHAPHIVEGLPTHQVFVLGELPWERASVVE